MTTATRLHQHIAAEKDIAASTARHLTGAYHAAQKPAQFNGFSKTYQPLDEEGTQLPPERQLITTRATDLIATVAEATTRLIDFTATKDEANQRAKGTITLHGRVLAENVPVSTLLTLEKKLVDTRTFIAALPTLALDESWTWSEANGHYASEPTQTIRQTKERDFRVVVAPTDRHPAQVVEVARDVVAGRWTTAKFSAAVSVTERQAMLNRVDELIVAVKQAREAANATLISPQSIGAALMGYVFQ